MATNWKLGRECTLSIGSNALKLAKEVTVELGGSEADVTTRDSQGIKRTVLALKELTISGTAIYSPDDVAVQALVSAYTGDTAIEVTVSDPTLSYTGKWAVTSLSQGQPLEDVATLDFTLKPTLEASSS
jgi:TP901-1 family phage major tail protein